MAQQSIKKCQTTFKILNWYFLMSIKGFFHVIHFTFRKSVDTICWYIEWHYIYVTMDGEGGEKRGAEIYVYLWTKANDYFMWQSPDSWILKRAMTEVRVRWEGVSRGDDMVFDVFPYIAFGTCVCDKQRWCDWRNGNKIKLKFLSPPSEQKIANKHHIWYDTLWNEGIHKAQNLWKAASSIFPLRAHVVPREKERGRMISNPKYIWKASVRKICFCGFLLA